MACEESGIKDYFLNLDLESARVKFMERASSMPYCMAHQPSNQEYINARFLCLCNEGKIDDLWHWRGGCHLYSKLKESNWLQTDQELTKFYSDIIKMRSEA